jgi:hypothetical protein
VRNCWLLLQRHCKGAQLRCNRLLLLLQMEAGQQLSDLERQWMELTYKNIAIEKACSQLERQVGALQHQLAAKQQQEEAAAAAAAPAAPAAETAAAAPGDAASQEANVSALSCGALVSRPRAHGRFCWCLACGCQPGVQGALGCHSESWVRSTVGRLWCCAWGLEALPWQWPWLWLSLLLLLRRCSGISRMLHGGCTAPCPAACGLF